MCSSNEQQRTKNSILPKANIAFKSCDRYVWVFIVRANKTHCREKKQNDSHIPAGRYTRPAFCARAEKKKNPIRGNSDSSIAWCKLVCSIPHLVLKFVFEARRLIMPGPGALTSVPVASELCCFIRGGVRYSFIQATAGKGTTFQAATLRHCLASGRVRTGGTAASAHTRLAPELGPWGEQGRRD